MASHFIRCPSCGNLIASYVDFFDKAREALYKKEIYSDSSKLKDYDPEKLALNSGSTPPLEDLFNALGIENRCCRMRITTRMEFDKLYK